MLVQKVLLEVLQGPKRNRPIHNKVGALRCPERESYPRCAKGSVLRGCSSVWISYVYCSEREVFCYYRTEGFART